MGAEPWMYFVPYQEDIEKALTELRVREFNAGRYFPAVDNLWMAFPIGPNSPSPGAQHKSIDEALAGSSPDGTRSILDMLRVSDKPEYFAVSPMDEGTLEAVFGTTRPTHEMASDHTDFFEEIERGQGVYAIIYKDDTPDEILFAGYSFD